MIAAPPEVLEKEQDWRAILSRIAEGVILLDADGVIQFMNKACISLLNLECEIVGQTLGNALAGSPLADLANAALAGGETPPRGIMIARPGGIRWLYANASMWNFYGHQPPGVLLVFHDITTQRALEEVRSDFVANVSHELRTPISILAGYIENLAEFPKMPRSEQIEIFGIMQEHATRLKALLEDLLTLACFESGSEVLDYAELDLNEFLRRLEKDWQTALASKDMVCVLEIADDARFIRVDRFRFEQVMHNLFDNAFKYTPIEGQIRVRALVVGDHIDISVEDNGAGIPQEDLPHIFKRFYRVDKARSRKYGGTGLGLSIVKHIIALHGGTVRAESTLQMSTRIIISLPRVAVNALA